MALYPVGERDGLHAGPGQGWQDHLRDDRAQEQPRLYQVSNIRNFIRYKIFYLIERKLVNPLFHCRHSAYTGVDFSLKSGFR